ncbi:MAG: TlpA family protein disulfide reductase [Gammaproteobacteria bacterium]|nr:TlpA family protein disulfide reductase [Gammaproteobacteria bacterium]
MRILFTLMVLLFAVPLGAQPQPAPDFALKSISGENQRLSEYRGQVVVVAFWASWCGECPELLVILQRLHTDIAGSDAQILGVSVDDRDTRAERAAADVAGSYPILLDVKQDVVKRYEIEKIPAVVIVDRDGVIATRITGSAVLSTDYGAAVRTVLER